MEAILTMGNNKGSPRRKAHLLLEAVDKYSKKQAGIGNAVQKGKRGRVWVRIWASTRFMPKAYGKRKKWMGPVTWTDALILNYGKAIARPPKSRVNLVNTEQKTLINSWLWEGKKTEGTTSGVGEIGKKQKNLRN